MCTSIHHLQLTIAAQLINVLPDLYRGGTTANQEPALEIFAECSASHVRASDQRCGIVYDEQLRV
ncbi:hypothetical protein O4160_25090 [Rhodococcus sp. IEGM 1401]|uniref:hypothetical protein n=1 Tax=Rhodococcus sp. IEGM 1372 TaxID=3047087 RepID=UPI0022B4C5A4|nr:MULTISPECIES: hypothetical protein [unclassified Rhodococcus (in: high G+C Gram-positive bacteria)]MCZ4564124.1 hypothetical protein [Rhodococcus sp. IEGM 1401]MDI9924253.1 hypothetical protein [Rhodococcus sp. IEGM 1372]MDV8036689.1 hypothetical protein [Rhodococcus sp. IEGM 1414]